MRREPSTSYATVASYVPGKGIVAGTSTRPTYRTRAPAEQVSQATASAPPLSDPFPA